MFNIPLALILVPVAYSFFLTSDKLAFCSGVQIFPTYLPFIKSLIFCLASTEMLLPIEACLIFSKLSGVCFLPFIGLFSNNRWRLRSRASSVLFGLFADPKPTGNSFIFMQFGLPKCSLISMASPFTRSSSLVNVFITIFCSLLLSLMDFTHLPDPVYPSLSGWRFD